MSLSTGQRQNVAVSEPFQFNFVFTRQLFNQCLQSLCAPSLISDRSLRLKWRAENLVPVHGASNSLLANTSLTEREARLQNSEEK